MSERAGPKVSFTLRGYRPRRRFAEPHDARVRSTSVMRTRAARILVPFVAALVVSSCIFGQPDTTKPTPTPGSTTTPGATRPRLELSTYQYGLQVKGKIRVGVLDKDQPFSVRSGGSYDGFDADIAREIARAIWGPNDDPDTHIEWVS